MDDYDFELFKDELKTAVKRVHLDKIQRLETYIDINMIQYKIVIKNIGSVK